jgi:hypothetical protein
MKTSVLGVGMKGMHQEDSSMNNGYILRLQSNASLMIEKKQWLLCVLQYR